LGEPTFVEQLEKMLGPILQNEKPGRKPREKSKQVWCPQISDFARANQRGRDNLQSGSATFFSLRSREENLMLNNMNHKVLISATVTGKTGVWEEVA